MTLDQVVATEVCPETGSWLADLKIRISKLEPDELQEMIEDGTVFEAKTRKGRELGEKAGISFERFVIRLQSNIERAVSYQLHTNRELRMMVDGKKDFSVFCRHISEPAGVEFSRQKFSRFRGSVKKKVVSVGEARYTFFFLKGAEWKVQCYLNVISCISVLGASEHTEFLEGLLLGYTLDQNREYISKFWRQRFAPMSVFFPVGIADEPRV